MKIEIHTDGSSNLQTKRSGHGWTIKVNGKPKRSSSSTSTHGRTSNEEEYLALIDALLDVLLTEGTLTGSDTIYIKTDSELMVKQILEQYQTKAPKLRALRKISKAITESFNAQVFIEHISRELNTEADELARKAMEE